METSTPRKSFVINREVLVPFDGGLNAIVRTVDGGFVIAGVRVGVAWALRTDPSGTAISAYQAPLDPSVKTQYQSAFNGAAALADGGALLCGQTSNKDHQAGIGLIVLIDTKGDLVEHRTVFPNDDHSMYSSSFSFCIPWGSGFAVTGRGSDGQHGFIWLMKLDKDGTREWEKTGPDLPGAVATVTADQDLVLMGSRGEGVAIVRLDPQGNVVARRETKFREAKPVQSVAATSIIKLIAVDTEFRNFLVSLSSDLKDASPSPLCQCDLRHLTSII